MQKKETQQFSKFFIKDIKLKFPKYHGEKSDINNLNLSSAS